MADAPPSSHDTNASGPITGSNAHRVWLWLVGTLWVAFVLWFGVDLVLHRQFQVDEFQNATNITFLSGMRGQNWATSAAPWQVWLTPVALAFRTDTESIMHALRAVFGAILVLNLLLLVWAEPHFRSPWGRMAVLWLGTLTDIFWRYGFEIRHDALILTVQLLTYGIAQRIVRSPGTSKRLYGAAGFLLTLMALSTIKGAVYAVLYTLLLVVIANPLDPWRVWRGRLAPALWYLLGACCAVLGVVVTLWLSGSASMYLHWLTTSSDAVTGLDTFSIIRWLHRPPPLTVGLSALVFYFAWRDIQRTRGQAITTSMVSACFVAFSMLAFAINPTPFPYNFLAIAGVLLLSALESLHRLRESGLRLPTVVIVALLLVQGADWCVLRFKTRYMSQTNEVQLSYIRAAEAVTGAHDPVIDGVGMVLTRPVPGRDWLLHSSLRTKYVHGERETFRYYLQRHAPPVVITNYRWDWLTERHKQFLKDHYLAIDPHFHLLGMRRKLGENGKKVEIVRTGRYLFQANRGGGTINVDGTPTDPRKPIHLSAGKHEITGTAPSFVFAWVGPNLEAPPGIQPTSGAVFLSFTR